MPLTVYRSMTYLYEFRKEEEKKAVEIIYIEQKLSQLF